MVVQVGDKVLYKKAAVVKSKGLKTGSNVTLSSKESYN
jgi:hypothetical protein